MGLSLFSNSTTAVSHSAIGFSRSEAEKPQAKKVSYSRTVPIPMPDPRHYEIMKYKTIGRFLILKVRYAGCTNYEGTKILMFENVSNADIAHQGVLDPHFSRSEKFHHPIARFVPTEAGWKMAIRLAHISQTVGV